LEFLDSCEEDFLDFWIFGVFWISWVTEKAHI
jgi:hypothetical protein